jgi:hypothetical protein
MTKLNDDILASTGNTAKEQEMFFAGVEAGEANAKNNAAVRAAPAAPVSTVEQDERQAFEAWGLKDCEMLDDPSSMRMDIAQHCAWEAWQARARLSAPAACDALDAARYRALHWMASDADLLQAVMKACSAQDMEKYTPENLDALADAAIAAQRKGDA